MAQAIKRAGPGGLVVPVFVLGQRLKGNTDIFDFPKTGSFRASFIIETLTDLRQSLRDKGSDLVCRVGDPATVLAEIASATNAVALFHSIEITEEEKLEERAVGRAMKELGLAVETSWTSTLLHPTELPFDLSDTPEIFTQYRVKIEKNCLPRQPIATPAQVPPLPKGVDSGPLPTVKDFGVEEPIADTRNAFVARGGESAALARLKQYIWADDRLRTYKTTRNGLMGADYSTRFSPWLAVGALSPRTVVAEVARYEHERVKNESTYWLQFELLWRDFFRFMAAKHGNAMFKSGGLRRSSRRFLRDPEVLERWRTGMTGVPFIDAAMRELMHTGWQSNRSRQNVASFLVHDLGQDWRYGAEWFESQLIDYDVCSNWGNWQYVSGVGNDPRQDRRFNPLKQARDYDPRGLFARRWIPELEDLTGFTIHEPWDAPRKKSGKYPKPIIPVEKIIREAPAADGVDQAGSVKAK